MMRKLVLYALSYLAIEDNKSWESLWNQSMCCNEGFRTDLCLMKDPPLWWDINDKHISEALIAQCRNLCLRVTSFINWWSRMYYLTLFWGSKSALELIWIYIARGSLSSWTSTGSRLQSSWLHLSRILWACSTCYSFSIRPGYILRRFNDEYVIPLPIGFAECGII